MSNSKKCMGLKVLAIIAIAFGLLTLKSGGEVLFIDGSGREAAGNYVPFVLWFNFLMGFLYIVAGVGLWLQKRWAVWLAIFIALATLVIFAVFGVHVAQGGLYEQRTLKAMVLRSSVWTFIALVTYFRIIVQNYAK